MAVKRRDLRDGTPLGVIDNGNGTYSAVFAPGSTGAHSVNIT